MKTLGTSYSTETNDLQELKLPLRLYYMVEDIELNLKLQYMVDDFKELIGLDLWDEQNPAEN